ncbi:MAG: DUF3332 family protein [Myxococcota bacterium]
MVLALVLTTGCVGSFRLTRSVYAFNDQVTDSVVLKEVVFVAFLIVPVYEVSFVADSLFLNVAEAVKGESLIRTVPPEAPPVAVVVPAEDGAWIEVSGQRARRVVRRGGTLALLEDGQPIATVTADDDGAITVTRDGRARRVPAEAVARVTRAARQGGDALAAEIRTALAGR